MVYSRLAGYEDTTDAVRRARDPGSGYPPPVEIGGNVVLLSLSRLTCCDGALDGAMGD